MMICNKCGKLVSYNSYFGGYYCTSCGNLERSTSEAKPSALPVSSLAEQVAETTKKLTQASFENANER